MLKDSEHLYLERGCPMCGSSDLTGIKADGNEGKYQDGNGAYIISCGNCLVDFTFSHHVKETAIDLWMSRQDEINKIYRAVSTLHGQAIALMKQVDEARCKLDLFRL